MKFEAIDIHTHINLAAFSEDGNEVIKKTLENKVAMINVGTQLSTSKQAIELSKQFDEGVYATVGLHPTHTGPSYHDQDEFNEKEGAFAKHGEEFDIEVYKTLGEHSKVVAIGECGLDYFRMNKDATKDKQKEVFIKQIQLAKVLEKPLMLHIRPSEGKESMDAYLDALSILKSEVNVGGNVHFFVGNKEIAKQFYDIGFTTSFTGVITFTHDYDEVIKYAPSDCILSETDAPYVAPVPHRGKRNEPGYVLEIINRISEIRGISENEAKTLTLENALRVFRI